MNPPSGSQAATVADSESRGNASTRRRLQIAVSGASGLVGSRLVAMLQAEGHRVHRLVRRASAADPSEICWDPMAETIETDKLVGLDAVVNLAGENIAAGRWNPALKSRIRESRVRGTRLLAEALASSRRRPSVLINASAIGYYGDRGDTELSETSAAGNGFLADTCQAWEAATRPAVEAGLRVVKLRIGVVLTPEGGALQRMLLPFKLGVGGRIGSGRQWVSWIGLGDLIQVLRVVLFDERLSGPVNAVAPHPVTNAELTRVLARVLRRPAIFPVPAAVIRLLVGEMGQALLLASTRVVPERLESAGFRFAHPDLESALRAELGR